MLHLLHWNPVRSLLVFLAGLVLGQIDLNREFFGREAEMPGGERFIIFRAITFRKPLLPAGSAGATFIVRFRLAGMTVQQNIRFSWIPIPFFAGLPGFRSKLWMYNPKTGENQGVYEWETVEHAESYARSFALHFMTRRSVPGSVSYRILPHDRRSAVGL